MKTRERCVATSSDAEYFPALMALLRSLERTNPRLPVVVFDGGLTRRQAAKAGKFALLIRKEPFVDIKGRGKFSYIGTTTLLKFEAAGLDHEKVLYLDADMVVLEKLDPLFSFPRGRVGVVRETNLVKHLFRVQHREMMAENVDIDWDAAGFNAGLFVLRPGEWRDLKERAQDLVDRFGADVFSKTKDQQLLNIIFSGRTHDLSERYNFSPFYDEGKFSPAIVHYLTRYKPWHFDYPPGYHYGDFRRNISVFDLPEILAVDASRALKGAYRGIKGLLLPKQAAGDEFVRRIDPRLEREKECG